MIAVRTVATPSRRMDIPPPNFFGSSVTISSASKNTAAVILRAVGKVFPPFPRFLAPISIRISPNYNANTGPCIATELPNSRVYVGLVSYWQEVSDPQKRFGRSIGNVLGQDKMETLAWQST